MGNDSDIFTRVDGSERYEAGKRKGRTEALREVLAIAQEERLARFSHDDEDDDNIWWTDGQRRGFEVMEQHIRAALKGESLKNV